MLTYCLKCRQITKSKNPEVVKIIMHAFIKMFSV